MERPFRDGIVRQNHKTGWFNATDLLKVANEYRTQIGLNKKAIADYLKNDSTKEFIKEILDRESLSKAYESKKGNSGGTWVHPLLLIDIAMWLSPEFKYEAMQWLQDELIKNRDISGESYKKLSSYLSRRDDIFPIAEVGLVIPKVASYIKKRLNVEDWNNQPSEILKARDDIHNNFMLLLDGGVDKRLALKLSVDNVINSLEVKRFKTDSEIKAS